MLFFSHTVYEYYDTFTLIPPVKHVFLDFNEPKVKVRSLSHVRLFATPWTVASQAPLSVGFSRQEYWSGLPFFPPGDLLNSGIEPGSPAWQADALPSEPPEKSCIVQTIA